MKTHLLFGGYPFLAGDKVTLSRITELDLKSLWTVWGDEENFRFLPTAALRSPAECTERLREAEQLFAQRRQVTLGIYPAQGEYRLIGVLTVFHLDPQVESASLSVVLAREYTGQGYASSAIRAAAAYLQDTVGVHRLQAAILPTNYRAGLALESCGFRKEGTVREGFFWPDKGIVDLTLYSLLPSDRRPQQAKNIVF